MEEQTKDIQDYLIAIKKRKTGIFAIVFILFLISALVAFLLPPKYKSSATILIEQQEIPQELVMSTVTSYAAERIQVIQARVMSRSNLMKIIDEYDLYTEERKYQTNQQVLKQVTSDISLDIISADVVDPRTGRPSSATIAFSVAFEGENPAKVQRIANELTSLYLNENLKNRAQKAEDTSIFFQQETDRLGRVIDDLGQQLADFKQKNASMLPEMKGLNMQHLQRKESEIANLDTRVSTLEEKIFYLSGQLAQIDPSNPAIASVDTRLKYLESEYASVGARYSENHPDVVRLKSEIEALKNEIGGSDRSKDLATQLKAARTALKTTRDKYTADHPDVISMNKRVASLEKELESERANSENTYFMSEPDNPAYITLKAQLASAQSEVESSKKLRAQLIESRNKLENSILLAPQVEREYTALARDYENANLEYKSAKAKLSRADTAKTLESENKGERFTLIDPPALPEEPFSPNRPAILFLGIVFSVFCGLGFAFASDAVSGAIRGSKGIVQQLGVAPLAVIPYQLNMQDIQKKSRFKKRTILIGVVAIVAGILLVHLFISPLDVLWFRVMRKLEILTA